MRSETPRDRLIRLLQNAHAGELAAFHAYEGHWRSLTDAQEIAEVQKIQREEREHRECVGRMLSALGSGPRPARELAFNLIGRTISALCRVGGWFVPMYGAGRLESTNIAEYEVAAWAALRAGHPEFVEALLEMAEVEWDHELYFRRKVLTHGLRRIIPLWRVPPPRASIRAAGPPVAPPQVPVKA